MRLAVSDNGPGISDAAAGMSPAFIVRSSEATSRSIPSTAAEAVYSASVQAMVNSIQHAGLGIQDLMPGSPQVAKARVRGLLSFVLDLPPLRRITLSR